jgi:type I restriction enzyme S subunit
MEERELPVGWTVDVLGEVSEIIRGITFPASAKEHSKSEDNVCCLRTSNIQHEINWNDIYFVGKAFVKKPSQLVRMGDVLMSMANSYELVGKVSVARDLPCETAFGAFLAAVRPTKALADQFLFYFLRSESVQRQIREGSSQTTNIANVSAGKLREIVIPVAPINEQRRIAAKLDTTLAAVDACRQRLDGVEDLLKRFRQAVLAAATSGELTREWREERGIVELNWKVCLTREAGKVQLGRQRAPKYHQGLTMRPYLRVQNVFEGRLDLEDVMEMDFSGDDLERYRLHPGDILLNEGQSPQFLGRPAMYRGELSEVCFTNSLIRFQAGENVFADFALLVFRHYMHSGRYIEEGTITTNIAHLSAGRFGGVEFPLPPLEEQQEIVRRTKELFSLADQLEARLTAARRIVERLMPALLAKAFRGELVPQDPNDEPASVLLERIRAARQAEATAGKPSRRARPKAAAKPDPSLVDATPVTPDLLASLLRECGALSERALLAASELDHRSFDLELEAELKQGRVRRVDDDGQVLVEAAD